ncbi:MAG: histidine triad nucleotide-binding protein [candidate division KSB1 bacterium]|nr:histidine triad nucleotide-binding protein [candidate division KSB1 bacterium]MDZ7345356.1 histidine triad nucleotide-binding protein [candidate division KSB1 bacterium]
MSCIFCRIISRQLPADIVFEDEQLLAFRDIAPQAPKHILIIPKRHIESVNDLRPEDAELAGKMVLLARDLANREGFDRRGYRLVMNCNHDGGQSVYHLHLHLLGGRIFRWPPG